MKIFGISLLLLGLILLISACVAPRSLPEGPTPIPTLIPATDVSDSVLSVSRPTFIVQSYPAQLPSASDGLQIYQQQCASCHGEDGYGTVPGARNFGDLDYMRGETTASFYAAITEGRGTMPGFQDRISSDARWDVVFYVWRFSTDAETIELGRQIYETNCVACHGADGTGEVLGAADLTDLRFVAHQAPRDFYLIITQGKGSMPAWQGRLSQDERWAVIDYLLTFSYDPTLPEEVTAAPQPTIPSDEDVCSPTYLAQTNPYAWDDDSAIVAGKLIYDQACAVCHGTDGVGTFPGTSDLSTAESSNQLRANSGQFLCIVAEGLNAMPGWKETLSTDEMWQVLTYIDSLGD
ncbi:MAG: c-type cytochrome [Anaerolineales bacterium]|nr:c-type cytochrome [Anaerolineales bacterium]